MARDFITPSSGTLPSIPTTERFVPGLNIFSGDGVDGCVAQIGWGQNLAHSTGHCGIVIQQCFADSQFVTTLGSAMTLYCRWKIPIISKQHTTMTCRVWAKSSSTTGTFRFTSTAGSSSTTVSSTTLSWFEVTLPVDTSTFIEDVTLSVQNDVEIVTISCVYDPVDDSGSWPIENGYLPSGVVELLPSGEFTPLDTLELDNDSPLTSDIGQTFSDNIDSLGSRRKMVYQHVGLEGLGHRIAVGVHRSMIPVNNPRQELTFYIYVTQATDDTIINIKASDFAHGTLASALYGFLGGTVGTDQPGIFSIRVPGDPSPTKVWVSGSFTPYGGLVAQAPGRYPNFIYLDIDQQREYDSSTSLSDIDIWSVCIQGY